MRHRFCEAVAAVIVAAAGVSAQAPRFQLEETTIAGIEAAFRDGSLTCRSLVEQYLARIDAYDKSGPSLNAMGIALPNRNKGLSHLIS